jgi:hypothetical protein
MVVLGVEFHRWHSLSRNYSEITDRLDYFCKPSLEGSICCFRQPTRTQRQHNSRNLCNAQTLKSAKNTLSLCLTFCYVEVSGILWPLFEKPVCLSLRRVARDPWRHRKLVSDTLSSRRQVCERRISSSVHARRYMIEDSIFFTSSQDVDSMPCTCYSRSGCLEVVVNSVPTCGRRAANARRVSCCYSWS